MSPLTICNRHHIFLGDAQKSATAQLTTDDITTAPNMLSTSTAYFVVGASNAVQLLILMPGENYQPGDATGKSGSPSTLTAGTEFKLTVKGCDVNWNTVDISAKVKLETPTDDYDTAYKEDWLTAGTTTFLWTFKTANAAHQMKSLDTDGNEPLLSTYTQTGINVVALLL